MRNVNCYSNYRNLVAGVDIKVPLIGGGSTQSINFDNAATTPPLLSVLEAITEFSPYYSSIHRGTGFKSQYASYIYEDCRRVIGSFVNSNPDKDCVIFVKNTTEAINKLAHHLKYRFKDGVVLSTCMEHHSNDLPWRGKFEVDYIAIDQQGILQLDDLEKKLKHYKGKVRLVAITGASNVTGYKNPIYKAAELAHLNNALILVDGAQLVPHAAVDMQPHESLSHIDFLAFSGHKMYAPFGTGVLIAPKELLKENPPDMVGGGTVDIVTHQLIKWAELPHKEEGGSPNLMGAIAIATAMKTLDTLGMKDIESYEHDLTMYAINELKATTGVQLYSSDSSSIDRVAIVPFNIEGIPHNITAKILSYEGGIAVRNGCFCAQPYIQRLLGLSPKEIEDKISEPHISRPGMVRISLGLYNTYSELDCFLKLIKNISENREYYLDKYSNIPDAFDFMKNKQ